jgi:hypothetical protein
LAFVIAQNKPELFYDIERVAIGQLKFMWGGLGERIVG